MCGNSEIIEITQKQALKISLGAPWIDVFDGDASMAERFISGTDSICWDILFAEEKEE